MRPCKARGAPPSCPCCPWGHAQAVRAPRLSAEESGMLPPPPPSGHRQLMGNFMGAAQRSAAGNMPEPSARRTWGCRAALTSARQTICRSRCRTLPSPRGSGCVTRRPRHLHNPPAPRGGPSHRAGVTTRQQRCIAETWESRCRSDTRKMWGLWESGHGTAAQTILASLLAPQTPRPGATSRAAIPPVPGGEDLESRLCPQSSCPATPPRWQQRTKVPGCASART